MQNWELGQVKPGDVLVLQTVIGTTTVDCFDLEVVSADRNSLHAVALHHGEQYRIDCITGSIFLRVARGVERRSSFQRVRKERRDAPVQECF